MRNNYEYTANRTNENNENREVNDMKNMNSTSSKKHSGAKITASLMAMLLVSAGSIGIYRQVSGNTLNNTTAVVVFALDLAMLSLAHNNPPPYSSI